MPAAEAASLRSLIDTERRISHLATSAQKPLECGVTVVETGAAFSLLPDQSEVSNTHDSARNTVTTDLHPNPGGTEMLAVVATLL